MWLTDKLHGGFEDWREIVIEIKPGHEIQR
jgi:hypothetical protein